MEINLARLKVIVSEEFSGALLWDGRRAMSKMTDEDLEMAVSQVLIPFSKEPVALVLFGLGICLAINRAAIGRSGEDLKLSTADIHSAARRYFPAKLYGTIQRQLYIWGKEGMVAELRLKELSDKACEVAGSMPQEHLLVGSMFAIALTVDHIHNEIESMEIRRRHQERRVFLAN